MIRRANRAIGAGLVACGLMFALIGDPGVAHAKAQRVVYYDFDQAWSTAVRFLRIDEGFEIVERDAEAGYVLFALTEENKKFQGALEIVRTKDEQDRAALRLVVRIEDRPTYMEIGILKRLERKLREEHGEQRKPPPPKAKPDPPADEGKPDSSG